jgi:hypothetical protein
MNPVGNDPAVDQKPGGGQHDAADEEEGRENSAFSSSSPSPTSLSPLPLPSPRRGRPHGQQQRQHQLQEPWMEAAEAFSSNTPHRSGGGLFPVRVVSRRSLLDSLSTAPSALTLP